MCILKTHFHSARHVTGRSARHHGEFHDVREPEVRPPRRADAASAQPHLPSDEDTSIVGRRRCERFQPVHGEHGDICDLPRQNESHCTVFIK